MRGQEAFLSPIPINERQQRVQRSLIPPRCSAEPPSLPPGAKLEPSPMSSIEEKLNRLRFGYEMPTPPPSACSIKYRCAHGHIVRTRPNSPACKICPTCIFESLNQGAVKGRKLTLCQVAALAHDRGGHLLSSKYVSARDPLVWRCKEGHIWKASVSNIRSGKTWCPECARQKKKLSIDDMHEMARQRGGQLLSTEYISEHVKLKWRCSEGHEFWLAPNNVRRNPNGARKPSWCKICRKNGKVPGPAKKVKVVASG